MFHVLTTVNLLLPHPVYNKDYQRVCVGVGVGVGVCVVCEMPTNYGHDWVKICMLLLF